MFGSPKIMLGILKTLIEKELKTKVDYYRMVIKNSGEQKEVYFTVPKGEKEIDLPFNDEDGKLSFVIERNLQQNLPDNTEINIARINYLKDRCFVEVGYTDSEGKKQKIEIKL